MRVRHFGIPGIDGRSLFVVALAALVATAAFGSPLVGPEIWLYDNGAGFKSAAARTTLKSHIDMAAADGYTGIVVADFWLSMLPWDSWGVVQGINEVMPYAQSKGIKLIPAAYSFGYSEPILRYDKNLGEGIQANGATFTVSSDGKSLVFNPRTPTTQNLGFETGSGSSATGWSLDGGVTRDTTTAHTGSASLKIGSGGRLYGIQTLTVQPYEQLHISFWAKASANFSGDLHMKMYDSIKGIQRDSTWDDLPGLGTAWKKYDLVVNTNNSTRIELRLGSWGGITGNAWFDDVAVEEVPLHNLIKNTASPLRIYRSNGTVLNEGTDVNTITDPNGFDSSLGGFSTYHTPPTVTINPATSGLHAGDIVKMDYVAAPGPIYNYESGVSLVEPGMWSYVDQVNANMHANFPAGTGIMMGYDEMRNMNTSPGEKALGLTAGQLLAQHVATLTSKIAASCPASPLFTWSDMFDPNHNAVSNYYYVDGTIGASGTIPGSWAGLPRNVTVINWMHTAASLQWFGNTLGNPQLISDTNPLSDYQNAAGVKGVRGYIRTVWNGDFSASSIAAYANNARAAWTYRIPGDANKDNMVDQADYTIWYNNYGSGTMWEQADFNGDAIVDQADYTIWYNNYGSTGGSIPEPATLSLLAAAGLLTLGRKTAVNISAGRGDPAGRS